MGRRFLVAGLASLLAGPASAHGFGQRYDLPLPLDLFVLGGAAAVALSFVVAALVLRTRDDPHAYPALNLAATRLGKALTHPLVLRGVRVVAALVFALTLAAGYIGVANPYRNIAVVTVWVVAWVGIAYVSALLGNIWALVNPWSILFAWGERIGRISLDLPYPAALGAWPGVALFFAFAWLEINWSGSGIPVNIAVALSVYSLITWTGMALFGRETWLRHGEIFAIAFGLFARFSVTEVRDGAWRLRPPAVGLFAREPASPSLIAFILTVLASVTYDGFTETEPFQIAALMLYDALQELGPIAVPVVSTIGLASFPVLFVIAYVAIAAILRGAGGGRDIAFARIAGTFVFSLVPIAIAYHLAHYLSLLVFEGQNVIALVSDPFGFGWDLFGTADYEVDLTIMSTRFVWHFSVAAIVLGHIAAVYLAHVEAMHLFADRRKAFLSQVPMLVLMVGYTMASLWIVAQPIVS